MLPIHHFMMTNAIALVPVGKFVQFVEMKNFAATSKPNLWRDADVAKVTE